MADTGLDRTKGAGSRPAPFAKSLAEAGEFDGIAQLGPRAMGLDIADLLTGQPGADQGSLDHFALGQGIGYRVAGGFPAMIDGTPPDQAMNPVAIGQGAGQRFQDQTTDPFARHKSFSIRPKTAAVTVRTQHAGSTQLDIIVRMQIEIDPPGQSHFAIALPQVPDSLVNGCQRRGTHGVDGQTRPLEVQTKGHPVGDTGKGGHRAHPATVLAVPDAVMLVAGLGDAGENPHPAAMLAGQPGSGIAGILER